MLRKLFFSLIAAFTLHTGLVNATVQYQPLDTVRLTSFIDADKWLRPITPEYTHEAVIGSPWNGHWFVNVSGGTNAFLGKQLGCEDLFGRMQLAYTVSLGKWFTPQIGTRVTFQNGWFEDADIARHGYRHYHADLLWNILGSRLPKSGNRQRWGFTPFVGVGAIHNTDSKSYPIALSYGVQGMYNISRRLSATLEFGNTTTCQHFDGIGKTNRPGDNMLSLSTGLTFNIGQTSWKRVVNADPYIRQNEWLMDYAIYLRDNNSRYSSLHAKDKRTIEELHKIMEIEGLLDKYGHLFDKDDHTLVAGYPRNDYSGLNSLRARLRNRSWNGQLTGSDKAPGKHASGTQQGAELADTSYQSEYYITLLKNGGESIGAPIYFFFQLGTTLLTDSSQLVNLDELARIANEYNLAVVVVGAADSATGNVAINDALSASRAAYIAAQLRDRGVANDAVTVMNTGGINDYEPLEANRHTRVALFFKH